MTQIRQRYGVKRKRKYAEASNTTVFSNQEKNEDKNQGGKIKKVY